MAIKFPDKDPQEVLEYSLDFKNWLSGGDAIQAVGTSVVQEGTSTPGGLTDIVVDSVVVASNIVVAWISGGTTGEKYTFKYLAVDNNSPVRTVVRRTTIKIKEK